MARSRHSRRPRIAGAPLALLCLALLGAPATGAEEWTGRTADQVISHDDNEYARGVELLLAGSLHAFWSEDAPTMREIHYGRSTNEGDDWSSQGNDRLISFPDGNEASDGCAAAGRGDPLLVVWAEEHTGTREIHYGISNDGGETWSCESQDLILSDPTSAIYTGTPAATIDQDGALHVVWHQSTPGGVAEIHYGRSTDGGLTWSSSTSDRVISFPDGNPAVDPSITASENTLCVVWREDGDSGDPQLHVGLSTDSGLTWSSETADRAISQPATILLDPVVASALYDTEVGIVAVYQASFDTSSPYHYEIYASHSYDGGATWSGEASLVPVSHDEGAGNSAFNPDVAVRAWGGFHAVWDEEHEASGTKEQHYSFGDGDSWSGATADSLISFPDGENGYRPSIVATDWIAAGASRGLPLVHVAWTEFAGGASDNYEVHFSKLLVTAGAVEADRPGPRFSAHCSPNPSGGIVRIAGAFPFTAMTNAGARVSAFIFDPAGRCVRHLSGRARPDGSFSLGWSGRDDSGRRVAPGMYLARLRIAGQVRAVPIVRL